MKMKCEIGDYTDNRPIDSAPIIIEDAWPRDEMIKITVGGKTVTVVGEEMIKAIERCMHTHWPY